MWDGYRPQRRETPVRERIRAGAIRVALSAAALGVGVVLVLLSVGHDSYNGENALQMVGVLTIAIAGMLLLVFLTMLIVDAAFWFAERRRDDAS